MSSPSVNTTTPAPRTSRWNVKLLLCGVIALAAAGLAIVALDRHMRARRDRQMIQWAAQAMAAGRYEDAAAEYARAVARHPDDPDLSLRSGDAFYALSAARPEAMQNARIAWEAAVRNQPNDLAALRRLLHFYVDLADVRPDTAGFTRLGEIARQILAASHADPEAASAERIAALGDWFSHIGPWAPGESAAHDRALAALESAGAAPVADPLALRYAALAAARRAVEMRADANRTAAHARLDECERFILSVADTPNDHGAELGYRAAEALAVLADAHQRLNSIDALAPATRPATTRPTTAPAALARMSPTWDALACRVDWGDAPGAWPEPNRRDHPATQPADEGDTRCLAEARRAISAAAARASGADVHFVDIQMLAAGLARRCGDQMAAEKICRAALSIRPQSLRVQVALAELLSASHSSDAIALLDQPDDAQDAGPGPRALTRRASVYRADVLRAGLWLDVADAATGPPDPYADVDPAALARRDAAIAKAATACDALIAMLVEDHDVLKLVARLRLLQHRYPDALRAADRALAMAAGRSAGGPDIGLLSICAATLLAMHDAERAIDAFHSVVASDPARTLDRESLARTLLDEGRLIESEREVHTLQKQLGVDDPRVIELRLALLIAHRSVDPSSTSEAEVRTLLGKLPESSVAQMRRKAESALSAGDAGEAVRLLTAAHSAAPKSVSVAAQLAAVLLANDQAVDASSIISAALKEHPGDAALLAARRSLGDPANLGSTGPVSLEGVPVDVATAVRAGRQALESHDLSRAREQLDAAARVEPESLVVADLGFSYGLAAKQWGDAGAWLEKLAAANADGVAGRAYAGRLATARGRDLTAACLARQITLRNGRVLAGWLALGDALQKLGLYSQAIDVFRRASDIAPSDVHALRSLATCCRADGRGVEADAWIAKARRVAPADAQAREIEFSRQLSEADPRRLFPAREAEARRGLPSSIAAIELARVYLRISDLEAVSDPKAAQAALAKAVSVLNDAVKRWPDDADTSFWAAHTAALSGDVAGAKQVLRRLCDRDAWTKRPEPSLALAEFCMAWGDPSGASVALRDAAERGATGALLARRRSGLLTRLGDWQGALDVLRPYAGDPLAERQRFATFLAARRGRDAEMELIATHSAQPDSGRSLSWLGFLHAATGDDANAIRWLDRAIEAGDVAVASRDRATIRLRDRRETDPARAIQELTIALEATPSDTSAALLLADAYARGRDTANAIRVLRAALSSAPEDKDVRLALVAMERAEPAPNWERIAVLINDGRRLFPSDGDWDTAEARMWEARGNFAMAAALVRRAVQLASSFVAAADPALSAQGNARLRALWPDEFRMLLDAHAHEAASADADAVIARYGTSDMLSAWAHETRAEVQRRTGIGGIGDTEYTAAIATAKAAGGFDAATRIVETISAQAGADEAIRRIDKYLADTAGSAGTAGHDPRWDLLRIDLLRRNNELAAAAAEVGRIMPSLSTLDPRDQFNLLRLAIVVYLQDDGIEHAQAARAACEELLKRAPGDAWALNNLAVIWTDLVRPADPAKGLVYAQQAYAAARVTGGGGEADPAIADTYGWALALNGRGPEAVAVLEPIATRLGTAEAGFHLGRAYLAAKEFQSAVSALTTAAGRLEADHKQGRPVDPDLEQRVYLSLAEAVRMSVPLSS